MRSVSKPPLSKSSLVTGGLDTWRDAPLLNHRDDFGTVIESTQHQGEIIFTVEAVIDEEGNVKILQHVPLQGARRALLVILDEPALTVAETALLSEAALAEDWLRPEEEEAWSYLQRATS